MTFGFVWAESGFLVNDHINGMILPHSRALLPPGPDSISQRARDLARDPCTPSV